MNMYQDTFGFHKKKQTHPDNGKVWKAASEQHLGSVALCIIQ